MNEGEQKGNPADPESGLPEEERNPSPHAGAPARTVEEGPEPVEGILDRSLALVSFLRRHCAWDRKQTPRTLIPYLLEESQEVVDAILTDAPEELEGELGDLLLNLAFQIVIGEERNAFTRESVTERLEEKMMRRHPHLFGRGEKEKWETLKAKERVEGESVLAGLASGLDPLLKAHRMQEKVSGVGFDWDDTGGALAKVSEEVDEVKEALAGSSPEALEEELGDLLFSVVNLSRLAGVHASLALEKANVKFRRRFDALEALAGERGIRMEESTLEVLDGIWDDVKVAERKGADGPSRVDPADSANAVGATNAADGASEPDESDDAGAASGPTDAPGQ